MIGVTQEKLTLLVTLALDRPALSDVCGINLQYHCKTVSRVSKVYSVGLSRRYNGRKRINKRNRISGGYHEYQELWAPEIGVKFG